MSAPEVKGPQFSKPFVIPEQMKCIDNSALQWLAKKLGFAVDLEYNGEIYTVTSASLESFIARNGGPNDFHVKGHTNKEIDKILAQVMAQRPRQTMRIFKNMSTLSGTAKNIHDILVELKEQGVQFKEEFLSKIEKIAGSKPEKVLNITRTDLITNMDFNSNLMVIPNEALREEVYQLSEEFYKYDNNLYKYFQFPYEKDHKDKAKFKDSIKSFPETKGVKTNRERTTEAYLGEHKAPFGAWPVIAEHAKYKKEQAKSKFEHLPKPTPEEKANAMGRVKEIPAKSKSQRTTEVLLGDRVPPASTAEVEREIAKKHKEKILEQYSAVFKKNGIKHGKLEVGVPDAILKNFERIETKHWVSNNPYRQENSGSLARGSYVQVYNALKNLLLEIKGKSFDEIEPAQLERLGKLLYLKNQLVEAEESKAPEAKRDVALLQLHQLVRKIEVMAGEEGEATLKGLYQKLGIKEKFPQDHIFSPSECSGWTKEKLQKAQEDICALIEAKGWHKELEAFTEVPRMVGLEFENIEFTNIKPYAELKEELKVRINTVK